MLVGAEKQILSWIQQMKQTPVKQNPKPVLTKPKPAEPEEKPVELELWAQLVEKLGDAAEDSRNVVSRELQLVSAKLEHSKLPAFDFAKYLPHEPVAVKTEKPPSPPPATVPHIKLSSQPPAQGTVALADLVQPLPDQKWDTKNIVSKPGVEISFSADPLAKKRRITENTSLPIPKYNGKSANFTANPDVISEQQISLIVETQANPFSKQALLESSPDLEPLPDIAPEWDGSDEDAGVRVAEDAVVPVKRELGVKRESAGESEGKDERESRKRKFEDDDGDKRVRMLSTYQKYVTRWKAIKNEVDGLEKQGFRFAVIPNHVGTTFYLKAVPRLSASSSAPPTSSASRSPTASSSSFPSPAFYVFVPRLDNEPIKYSFSTELQCILEATKRENPSNTPVPVTHTNNTLPPTAEASASTGAITSATGPARENTHDSLRSMVRRFETQLAQVASPLTITSLGRTWAHVVNDVAVG
jgi:hypothetical protein